MYKKRLGEEDSFNKVQVKKEEAPTREKIPNGAKTRKIKPK